MKLMNFTAYFGLLYYQSGPVVVSHIDSYIVTDYFDWVDYQLSATEADISNECGETNSLRY